MPGYEITFSITAVCPGCGNDLPSNSYLTVSKPSAHPLDRDNPYERKDRRVFITPCSACFEPRREPDSAGVALPDAARLDWIEAYIRRHDRIPEFHPDYPDIRTAIDRAMEVNPLGVPGTYTGKPE